MGRNQKIFTVPELDTAFGLRLSSIFCFYELFFKLKSMLNLLLMCKHQMFRVNFELVFFLWNCCREIAEKDVVEWLSNIYFHCILFTRFSCGAIIIICHFLLFVLQSADLHPATVQKQSGPVVNTSSLPDIILVIKAKN